MYTLGINAVYHDSSACLVHDGQVLAAAEEERFTHVKHGKRPIPFSTYELPYHAIDYCLREAGLRLTDVSSVDNFNDLDGLAALVDACDVVVSVSNTTAHLAGALGKNLLVMLSKGPGLLWYWHYQRSDSPWYPTATLFRQETSGIWDDVVAAVERTVRQL